MAVAVRPPRRIITTPRLSAGERYEPLRYVADGTARYVEPVGMPARPRARRGHPQAVRASAFARLGAKLRRDAGDLHELLAFALPAVLALVWSMLQLLTRLARRVAVQAALLLIAIAGALTAAAVNRLTLLRRSHPAPSATVAVSYAPSIAEPARREQSFDLEACVAGLVPVLASLLVIGLAGLIYVTAAPGLLSGLNAVNTPPLAGRSLDEATQAARAYGIEIAVADTRPTPDQPKGTIISQVPAAGSQLRRGGTVQLVVSAGLQPPDVLGKPLDQARGVLIGQGWLVAPEVETRVANDTQPGVVIAQRPGPNEAAARKGPISLVVATRNLALGKSVQTSSGAGGSEAVDGHPTTAANSGGSTPNWLEIHLEGPVGVASLSLLPALERGGPSTIEVWAWDVGNRFFPLHTFVGPISDGEPVDLRLAEPTFNVTRLRIATTAAPAPIAWREISVSDR